MSALTISTSTTAEIACTVDLTSSASITRSATNPVIVIPVPTGKDAASFAGAFSINIKMMTQRIEIKFSLTDGVGTHSYLAPSTNYEKLWYMMTQDEGKKRLVWEGFTFTVEMTELTTPTEGGNFKLMQNCSVSLVVVDV
jgi:hypothetical protein